MPYIEKITRAGRSVLYERTYTTHIHPKGMKRAEKSKKTTEAQLKVNIRKAAREMTILMNENFKGGDYHVTLTYDKHHRPEDIREAQKDRSRFIKCINRKMKKRQNVKYIMVTEVGTRGALHHHLVIQQIPVDWITKSWPAGRVDIRPLDDTGQYSRLAEYFAKYIFSFRKKGGTGRGYTRSKNNLRRPETKIRIVRDRGYFREEPREKKGYYLDKDTVRAGISEFSGYSFLRYILVKSNREGRASP